MIWLQKFNPGKYQYDNKKISLFTLIVTSMLIFIIQWWDHLLLALLVRWCQCRLWICHGVVYLPLRSSPFLALYVNMKRKIFLKTTCGAECNQSWKNMLACDMA